MTKLETIIQMKNHSPICVGILPTGEIVYSKAEVIKRINCVGLMSSVTEKVEEVDLLSDHLVSQVQIIRQSDRGRALNSESAYSEIQKAYEALEQELLMAAGVSGV